MPSPNGLIAQEKFDDGYADMVRQLRQIRKDQNITHAELCHRLGVCDGLVSKWESGVRRPGSFLLSCWITALGAKMNVVPAPSENEIQIQCNQD